MSQVPDTDDVVASVCVEELRDDAGGQLLRLAERYADSLQVGYLGFLPCFFAQIRWLTEDHQANSVRLGDQVRMVGAVTTDPRFTPADLGPTNGECGNENAASAGR